MRNAFVTVTRVPATDYQASIESNAWFHVKQTTGILRG